jgi:diacylglycerol kinase family enzyme
VAGPAPAAIVEPQDSPDCGTTCVAAKTTVVIINESARQAGENPARRIAEIFDALGVKADVVLARTGQEIIAAARRAATDPSRHVVVAGGGDGTINAVASQVVGTDKALGILPLGTLNHFAKDLKIPQDLEAAARNIVEGRIMKVDVGEVNGRYFPQQFEPGNLSRDSCKARATAEARAR